MPDASEKTFQPSARKRRQARERGEIARSQDASNGAVLAAFLVVVALGGPRLVQGLAAYIEQSATSLAVPLTDQSGVLLLQRLLVTSATLAAPFLLAVLAASLAFNTVQAGGLSFSLERIRLDPSRLDPIQGLRRIVSLQGIKTLLTGLVKFAIIGGVAYLTIRPRMDEIASLGHKPVPVIVGATSRILFLFLLRVTLALVVLGAADWGFQKWRHERKLMMTRQEWKEDQKTTHGDPQVLKRIRVRQRTIALQRMYQDTEQADVVVTNPTRLAVALRYRQGGMNAPRVVAKGMNLVADRIRAIARKRRIPVVEDRPLARTLYQICRIGMEIPPKLYRPVAELLAYVIRLRDRTRGREVRP